MPKAIVPGLWLFLIFLCANLGHGQMSPYFTAINYAAPKDNLMLMLLPDYQLARSGPDFLTFMGMAQYGVTSRWTVVAMVEGQKISGLPVAFGGSRFGTYYRLFARDHLLNFTVYGEFENLNGAALYKMEVSGFGGEDLTGSLALARKTAAHTFEQRAIMYHDWGRTNLTFNFVNETGLESHENDFGYAGGLFRAPHWDGMIMEPQDGMRMNHSVPAPFSLERVGYGLEMIGALGNSDRFGFYWHRQQQYIGPAFSYAISPHWSLRMEPAFGLSDVSDRFVLRMGVAYSIDNLAHRLRHGRSH